MSLVDLFAGTRIGLRMLDRRGQLCTGIVIHTGARCKDLPLSGDTMCGEHVQRRRFTPAALVASVGMVQLEGVGWQTWRPGNRAWQTDAWRLYDIIGQLRFVSNWVANCVSRCILRVVEVDESGEAGNPVEDPDIAALAATPLGSGPAKDEALRLLAINLYVPGEGYIVAQADGGPDGDDLWFVVSGQMIRRAGDQLIIRRPRLVGGGDMLFREGIDLLMQVYTPHPADTDEPDSPARSAISDLRELEAIKKRELAELDSRLAGAGILFLPDGVDFPRDDGEEGGVQGFEEHLTATMSMAMSDRSSAAAVVPILATLDADVIDKIKHLTFWSEISDKLQKMREGAVTSLAQSLDIPPEVLTGNSEQNHWNAWASGDDAITSQIKPILSRIADALTTGYLRRALEEMGKDPDKYVYDFDTAPLTTRPNRATDALSYYGVGLLSEEDAIEAGAFRKDQMPKQKERLRRLATELLHANPDLLNDPTIRGLVGITDPIAPPVPGSEPVGPGDGVPADPTSPNPDPRALPEQKPQTEANSAVVAAVAGAVRRALTLAGNRMVSHRDRDQYAGVPRWALHAQVGPIDTNRANSFLQGAWDDLPELARDLELDAHQLHDLLHGFCVELLTRGWPYEPGLLRATLTTALRGRHMQTMAIAA